MKEAVPFSTHHTAVTYSQCPFLCLSPVSAFPQSPGMRAQSTHSSHWANASKTCWLHHTPHLVWQLQVQWSRALQGYPHPSLSKCKWRQHLSSSLLTPTRKWREDAEERMLRRGSWKGIIYICVWSPRLTLKWPMHETNQNEHSKCSENWITVSNITQVSSCPPGSVHKWGRSELRYRQGVVGGG